MDLVADLPSHTSVYFIVEVGTFSFILNPGTGIKREDVDKNASIFIRLDNRPDGNRRDGCVDTLHH